MAQKSILILIFLFGFLLILNIFILFGHDPFAVRTLSGAIVGGILFVYPVAISSIFTSRIKDEILEMVQKEFVRALWDKTLAPTATYVRVR